MSHSARQHHKNRYLRRVSVEAVWSYIVDRRLSGQTSTQMHTRYPKLLATGKKKPQIVTAVDREMLAFLWAIAVRSSDSSSNAASESPRETYCGKRAGSVTSPPRASYRHRSHLSRIPFGALRVGIMEPDGDDVKLRNNSRPRTHGRENPPTFVRHRLLT